MLLKMTQVMVDNGVAERRVSVAEGTDVVVCWGPGLSM